MKLEINLKILDIQKENQRKKNRENDYNFTVRKFTRRSWFREISNNRKTREINAQQLKKWLKDHYQLQTLDKVMVAINEEFVTDEDTVKPEISLRLSRLLSGG